MSGKEQIINSILGDAEKLAESIRADAAKKAEEILSHAENICEKMRADANAEMEKYGEEFLKRRLAVAELEIKKFNLSLRQELLARCFDGALLKAASLQKKDYLSLISGLLKSCEDGETVIISKNDSEVITQEFIDKQSKGKKLVLSKDYGDFKGGIKLVSKNYEKNLTLEALLADLREEVEPELNKILFKN